MSKPKSKTIKVPVPANKNAAELLLSRLGDLQAQVNTTLAAADRAFAEISATAAEECAPLAHEIGAITKAIRKWATDNRAELLIAGGKSVTLLTGTISWRDGPEAVALDEDWTEDQVMAQLDAKEFPDCIRTSRELNKERIKTLWPHLVEQRVRGLTLVQREFLRLHPLQLAEPIEGKKGVVNVVDRLDGKSRKEKAA